MSAKNPKVGEIVALPKGFSFTNTSGGTGTANSSWSSFSEPFTGESKVRVVKKWGDCEIGKRFIGEAVSKDLIEFLKVNAHETDKRVFFGEFDL